MADINFNCPACGHNLEVDENGAGLTVPCPECSKPIMIPIPSHTNNSATIVTCPKCKHPIKTSPEMVGQLIDCPACNTPLEIPIQRQSAPPKISPPPLLGYKSNTPTPNRRTMPSGQTPGQPGTQTVTTQTRPCPYCGETILLSAKKCKHCGEFLDKRLQATSQNDQSKSLIKPLFIAILLALIAGGVGYAIIFRMRSAAKETQQAEADREFLKTMVLTHDLILLASSKCVDMCSGYSRSWLQGIESEYSSAELYLLEKSEMYEKDGSVKTINDNKESVDLLMSKMANPNAKYQKAHQALVEMYTSYAALNGLAGSPSGSYKSYNESVNNLQSELIKHANTFKAYLPNN